MEPARKHDHDIEPDIRPDLRVIQGGSETTPDRPARGKLSTVSNEDSSQEGTAQQDTERELSKLEQSKTSQNNSESIRDQETAGTSPIRSTYTGKNLITKGSRLKKARKFLPAGVITGLLVTVAIAFSALLPLKGVMFLQNIQQYASEASGYAIERRTEYIMTRLLAVHLLKKAGDISATDGDAQAKMIFCKGASISCSLLATYGGDYFDKIIDVTVKERFGSNIKFTLTPKGQTTLGGKARSWDLEISRDLGDGAFNRTVVNMQSNKEAKAWLTNHVNKNLKGKSIVTRYLARSILMKRYGITHWRGFEKTSNKIDETRSKLSTAIIKNTVGKVSKRYGLYLACFSNPDTCSNMKASLNGDAKSIRDQIDALKPEDENYEKKKEILEKQLSALEKLNTGTSGDISDDDIKTGGTMKNIIMKRIAGVIGAVGIIMTVDMLLSAVAAVDEGAIDQVVEDMAAVTYIGLAYGDDAGIVTNIEKVMAGDGDMDAYGMLMGMMSTGVSDRGFASTLGLLSDAEKSPLYQYESGLISGEEVMNGSFSTTCSVDNKEQEVTLAKGELMCPEQKIVQNISGELQSNPAWQPIAVAAHAWTDTVGAVLRVVMNTISDLPVIKQIGDAVGGIVSQLTGPLMEWIMSLFFTPPTVGLDATGVQNYVGLSGAVRYQQNLLMEEGVGSDGSAYGAGGGVLSSNQQDAIAQYSEQQRQDEFNNQPLVARIFNPLLTGSFAQQFVARIPSSFGSLLSLPLSGIGYAASANKTSAATSTVAVNPFGFPVYGYAATDPALTNDPSTYDEDFCSTSATKRAQSYSNSKEDNYPIPVYTKTDPCALEKMVVGTMLNAQGVTDDPYSLKDPTDSASSAAVDTPATTGKPANVKDSGDGWTLKANTDYSQTACDPRTGDTGTVTKVHNGSTVRMCKINSSHYPAFVSAGDYSVASIISTNVINMFEAAYKDGVTLGISSAYRSDSTTQHGLGIALDLGAPKGGQTICWVDGGSKSVWDQCKAGTYSNKTHTAAFAWLLKNAKTYGFYNMAGNPLWEPWHWSPSGG